jgi:hypothetical protein
LGLTEEAGSVSSCDSCGEINRAVGLGPVEEGPLVFLSMGWGIGAGAREAVEEEVVLGRLRFGWLRAVVLDAPSPWRLTAF